MRIRTIKPEFFHHEELHELETETSLPIRLAFIGLWCAADREGRFKWSPKRLGVQILPYDDCDFSRVLDALATRGFIRKYACGTEVFGVIPTFLSHQVINNRERESELPQPLEYMDSDACLTRDPRVTHAGKAEGKGREGNKEGKECSTRDGLSRKKTKREAVNRDEFDAFFRELGLYPRDAEAIWNKWEGNGWTNKSQKIVDWKATVRSWKSHGYMPSQKSPSDYEPEWPRAQSAVEKAHEKEDDLMAKLLRLKEAEAREAAGDHPDYWTDEEIEKEEAGCF